MNNRTGQIISYALIGLLMISTSFLAIQGRNSKKELKNEKQSGQLLIESNEKLKKELAIVRDDFTKNSNHLDNIIQSNEKLIAENDAKINKLLYENKQGNNARKLLKEAESHIQALQSEFDAARSKYGLLLNQSEKQENHIAELESKNAQLREQLELTKHLISDNVSISATKGKKNKLTVSATRTNILAATLDIPSSSCSNLHYAIIFPGGTKVQSQDLPGSEIQIQPGTSNTMIGEEIKTAHIRFAPKQKLKKGAYKLLVYNGDNYLTSVLINLR